MNRRPVVLNMPQDVQQSAPDRGPERQDFIRALYWLLEERGLSQRDLADAMGWSTHTKIHPWKNLKSEPEAWEVFALERFLQVPAGTLSAHLGYVPREARSAGAARVEDAIAADPMLPEWGRRLLLTAYREVLNSRPGRRRG